MVRVLEDIRYMSETDGMRYIIDHVPVRRVRGYDRDTCVRVQVRVRYCQCYPFTFGVVGTGDHRAADAEAGYLHGDPRASEGTVTVWAPGHRQDFHRQVHRQSGQVHLLQVLQKLSILGSYDSVFWTYKWYQLRVAHWLCVLLTSLGTLTFRICLQHQRILPDVKMGWRGWEDGASPVRCGANQPTSGWVTPFTLRMCVPKYNMYGFRQHRKGELSVVGIPLSIS